MQVDIISEYLRVTKDGHARTGSDRMELATLIITKYLYPVYR